MWRQIRIGLQRTSSGLPGSWAMTGIGEAQGGVVAEEVEVGVELVKRRRS